MRCGADPAVARTLCTNPGSTTTFTLWGKESWGVAQKRAASPQQQDWIKCSCLSMTAKGLPGKTSPVRIIFSCSLSPCCSWFGLRAVPVREVVPLHLSIFYPVLVSHLRGWVCFYPSFLQNKTRLMPPILSHWTFTEL